MAMFDWKNRRKKLDRLLAASVGRQLLLLVGAWFVICLLGWGIARAFHYFPSSFRLEGGGDEFWWVVSRVLGLDYCPDVSTYWQRGLFVLLAFVGSFLLTGGVVSLFVTTCTKRMDSIRNGVARYAFKNHSVLVGWNSFSAPMIRQLWNKYGSDSDYEILILSDLDTTDVRDELRSQLDSQIEDRVYIYKGNPDSQEEIDALNLKSAREVIILGDADGDEADAQNLQTAALIANNLKEQKREKALTCFIQIQNLHSYGLLEQYDLLGADRERLNLYPFNFYEDWARKVLVNFERLSADAQKQEFTPLDYEPITVGSPVSVHLVISDFGHMGRAFLLQAARMCHYANGKSTRITVIDENMERLRDEFCAAYPEIFNIPDIQVEFIDGAFESEQIRKNLVEWAEERDVLLSIAICGPDDDRSLRRALTLPKKVRQQKILVFVRQDVNIGFSKMVDRERSHIEFFGDVANCCDIERVQDRMAQAYHDAYRAQRQQDGTFDESDPVCKGWEMLSEEVRRTNRNLADMIPLKLRAVGCGAEPGSLKESSYTLTDIDVEALARIEHNRWAADRLLAGWEHGPEKDKDLRISPYLVPYDELKDDIQEYDRIPAREIPELLAKYLNVQLVKVKE